MELIRGDYPSGVESVRLELAHFCVDYSCVPKWGPDTVRQMHTSSSKLIDDPTLQPHLFSTTRSFSRHSIGTQYHARTRTPNSSSCLPPSFSTFGTSPRRPQVRRQ